MIWREERKRIKGNEEGKRKGKCDKFGHSQFSEQISDPNILLHQQY